ncbi:E3 UFM1-protein ligase 1 [Mortierella sp. GBA30]|nr:E3 UFM1-protein ligase 1 [Mortierella sp. GBA30]
MAAIWNTLFGAADNPDDLNGPLSLSDDACGDLVHSLIRLGYLANVVTSLDGKSFITYEQLRKEMMIQLEKSNGRVSLLDLPRALNVNLSDIQDRAQEVIKLQPGRILQVQDELIKMEYLEDMTEHAKDELTGRGFITVAEMCRKHKFGIDFMRQFLKDRVGTTIDGHWDTIDRGLVVARWFLEQEKAKLLEMLGQLQEPTSLQSLRSKRIIQDQLFFGLCDILSKDPTLPGAFKGIGDQGIFVPHPYEQQQTEWIETFFRDNGFIEFDVLRKHGVADPKAFMLSNHPTALLLDTHIVSESIWSVVDASVEDTISNLSWIDVKPLVPSPLTKDDISNLLKQLPSLADPTSRIAIAPDQDHSLTGYGGGSPQEATIVQDSIVITSGQLQKCLLRMTPLLDRKMKAVISWRLSFGDGELMDAQDDMFEPVLSLKGLLEQTSATALVKKSSKLKKAQGGKDMGVKKRTQLHDFLTIHDVKEEIRKLEPDFDPALVNAVAGALYRDLLQNLSDRNRSAVLNQASEEDEQEPETIERADESPSAISILPALQALSKRAEVSSKGVEVFEDVAAKNSLSKYLLQSLCVELLDLVMLHFAGPQCESLSNAIQPLETSEEAKEARSRVLDAYSDHLSQTENSSSGHGPFRIASDDTALLMEFVPQDATEPFKRMRKLTAGSGKHKNLTEYLDIWSSFTTNPAFGLQACSVAESNDKQMLAEHMEELHRALVRIEPHLEAALMLHIVTLIEFQTQTGRMLHASGKYVPRILRHVRGVLEKQQALAPQDSEDHSALNQLDLLDRMLGSVLSNVKQHDVTGSGVEHDPEVLWQSVFDLGVKLSSLKP